MFKRYPSANHTTGPAVMEFRRKSGNRNLGDHLGNDTGGNQKGGVCVDRDEKRAQD